MKIRNYKKTVSVVLITCLIGSLCVGCGSTVSVTKEQNDLIAEYAAGIMLKYSFENQWEYKKMKANKNSSNSSNNSGQIPTKNNNDVNTQPTTSANTTDALVSLAQGLGISSANIKYSKYVVGNSYPTEEYALSVPAEPGKKIVAIEFNVSNPTSSNITFSKASSNLSMKLSVNGEAGVSQSVTILKNDIINMADVTISAGSSVSAVALFMVTESKVDNITSLSLSVTSNGQSSTKKLV